MEKNNLMILKNIVSAMVMGLLLAAMVLPGCNRSSADGIEEGAVQARPVKVMAVTGSRSGEIRSFPGIVEAAREIDLAFRVGGPLVTYDLKVGQQVKRGETLARIDPRDFQIRVQKLTAELTAAEARLEDARRDFQRQKNLLAESAASQAQYDKTKMSLETTQAGIDSLMADLAAAENALADTRLTAPFDGVVNRKFTENHETVSPGMPVVSLLDLSSMEVATAVPEDIVIHQSDFGRIYATLDAHPGLEIEGALKEIGHQTDTANQSYPMTAVLAVPEGITVEPGMAATLRLEIRTREANSGYYLPTAAVFADAEGNSCVWQMDPDSLSPRKIIVETGELKGDTIEILTGISDGDRVICAGARFLVEGQPVRLLDDDGGRAS